MLHYFIVYKPYQTISQFTPEVLGDKTLADLGFRFPKDCYSVGRLDKDSEGLLLISNDNYLKTRFLNPSANHIKTYYVQVEGMIDEEALEKLRRGVDISVNGSRYHTLPATAEVLHTEPSLPFRNPPIRTRNEIPTSWIAICIREGKNRQVRKMCAAVGFPVLRLVRYAMQDLAITDLSSEIVTAVDRKTIYQKLNLS